MAMIEVALPGDKSIAHRAVVLGALARDDSRVANVSAAADVASSIAALRAFGAQVDRDGDRLVIGGRGAESLSAPPTPIDCGNSGTTARLCMGLAAALAGATVLTGDASLRRRPMERVAAPLRTAGAAIDYLERDGCLPVRVHGARLGAIDHHGAVASAQVKSALLVAALAAGVDATVREPVQSRDHTERLLRVMGADLETIDEETGAGVRLRAPHRLAPLDLRVPGDFSAAAFFVAAAMLGGARVTMHAVGLNPTRTGFLDAVRRMGADVRLSAAREEANEPVGDIRAGPADLRATRVDGDEGVRMIDELPLVAILGAHAAGETVVRGAAELRSKESDRIAALCANLRTLGVGVDEHADGFTVRGTASPLRGRVGGFGDHRIAMAFAVLGLYPGSSIEVDDLDLAGISFPGFGAQLERVRASARVVVGRQAG